MNWTYRDGQYEFRENPHQNRRPAFTEKIYTRKNTRSALGSKKWQGRDELHHHQEMKPLISSRYPPRSTINRFGGKLTREWGGASPLAPNPARANLNLKPLPLSNAPNSAPPFMIHALRVALFATVRADFVRTQMRGVAVFFYTWQDFVRCLFIPVLT